MKFLKKIKNQTKKYFYQFSGSSLVVTNLSLPCFSKDGGCDFNDLMQLASNFISFVLYLATLIAVFLFIYAGAMYIFSAGDSGKISKAHGIFTSTAIGMVIAFAAWLIVQFILVKLGVKVDFILVK
ncbi:MAG: hypothetical protein PHF79_00480 [Candidatus Pacebacteria bacterium]|nr:hypothetical protein [Candidatus Paceibacterota bacterium]